MKGTKAYGKGGRPIFLRLGGREREAWSKALKIAEEAVGKRLSYSVFAHTLAESFLRDAEDIGYHHHV